MTGSKRKRKVADGAAKGKGKLDAEDDIALVFDSTGDPRDDLSLPPPKKPRKQTDKENRPAPQDNDVSERALRSKSARMRTEKGAELGKRPQFP